MSLHLRAGSCSLQGRRSDNEDHVAVAEWPDAVVCVVADGMGGQALGRQASEAAVAALLEHLDKPARDRWDVAVADLLRRAFAQAHERIRQVRQELQTSYHACSTATLLFWLRGDEQVHLASFGDSLAFRCSAAGAERFPPREGVIAAALVAAGTITPEQAAPRRGWVTPLFRLLGADVEPNPDLRVVPLRRGDRFVLCSDGLTATVSDDQLLAFMKDRPDAQACAEGLARLAIEQGSKDNVSCIVVNVIEGE